MEENKAKIARLTELQASPGWQMVVKELQANIDELTHELCVGVTKETMEDIRVKQKQRNALVKLMKYPEDMIKALTPVGEKKEDNLDPYEQQE